MIKISEVIKNGCNLSKEMKEDENHRDRSWEHCYLAFGEYFKQNKEEPTACEKDYLCLHLAFYLASFGMYRGSSFLFNRDYKVHIEAINEIMKPEYKKLRAVKCEDYINDESLIKDLLSLSSKLRDIYNNIKNSVKNKDAVKNPVSEMLITKILMGTFGCVPAFDRFFIKCARCVGIKSSGVYKKDSLIRIAEYYRDNGNVFEKLRNDVSERLGTDYPQMRILDMCFCTTGAICEKDNGGRCPQNDM